MIDIISLTLSKEQLEAEVVSQPCSNMALSGSADTLIASDGLSTIGAADIAPAVTTSGESAKGTELPHSVESMCGSTALDPVMPPTGAPDLPIVPRMGCFSNSVAPLVAVSPVNSSLPQQTPTATRSGASPGLSISSEVNPEARREQLGLTPDLLHPPRHRGRRQSPVVPSRPLSDNSMSSPM
jgi:hypothetical protein